MTSAAPAVSGPVSSTSTSTTSSTGKAGLQVSTAPGGMTLLPSDAQQQSASPASTTSSSSAPSSQAGDNLTVNTRNASMAPTPEPQEPQGEGPMEEHGEQGGDGSGVGHMGMGGGMRRIGSGAHLATLQSKSYRRDTLLQWHVAELAVKSKAPKDGAAVQGEKKDTWWGRLRARAGLGGGGGGNNKEGLPTTAHSHTHTPVPPVLASEPNPSLHSDVSSSSLGSGGEGSGGERQGRRKRLLRGIVGQTRSGEMTAIMGPSGCGKTSLIECLSLRNRAFEGAIRLNGKEVSSDFFVSAGLVHQREMFFGFLTVREHLQFAVATKLGTKATPAERQARIDEVLREMGLWECADTYIGGTDPMFLHKGLSGGERKRLSIATELLQCPTILFLDEPTTGLDSVRAEDVVASLHSLAVSKGIVILSSIHMPSGEAVGLFSHLMLLTADGRTAYHGPMDKALDYFEQLGFPLPEVYSAVDYFLRLTSKDPLKTKAEECGRLDLLVQCYKDSPYCVKPPLQPDQAHKFFRGVSGLKVTLWELFTLNVWRGYIGMKRTPLNLILWTLVNGLNGVLLGTIFYRSANTQWRSLTGLLFVEVVALLMMNALPNIVRFPLEWVVVVREYLAGHNALGPYVVSKAIYDLQLLLGPILLATILYWMTGLDADLVSFLRFVGVTELIMLTSMAVGLFLASFSANPVVGFYLCPCFLTPMILFSGLLYQRSSVPPYLAWMQELSVVNYGFSALLSLTVGGLPQVQQDALLKFTEVDPNRLPLYVGRLCVMYVACYVLTYLSLRVRVTMSANTNV